VRRAKNTEFSAAHDHVRVCDRLGGTGRNRDLASHIPQKRGVTLIRSFNSEATLQVRK